MGFPPMGVAGGFPPGASIPGIPRAMPAPQVVGAGAVPTRAPPPVKKDVDAADEKLKDMFCVYVGNIATDVETGDLREILDQCGALANLNRIKGADKEPRPMGFATYETAFAAARAVRILCGFRVGSKSLSVKVDPDTRARIEKTEPPPSEALLQQDAHVRDGCVAIATRAIERLRQQEAEKNATQAASFMDTMADDADGVDVPVGLIAPPSLPPGEHPSNAAVPPIGPPPGAPPPGAPPPGPPPAAKELPPRDEEKERSREQERELQRKDQEYRSDRRKYESNEKRRMHDMEDDESRAKRRAQDAARFVERQRELEANYDDEGADGDVRYYKTKFMQDLKSNWKYEQRWMTADREKEEEAAEKVRKAEEEAAAKAAASAPAASPSSNGAPATAAAAPASTDAAASFGFGLKGQAQQVPPRKGPVSTAAAFGGEDEDDSAATKKRKLVPIAYTDQQLRAVGIDPELERKKRRDEIIASIPTDKSKLFAYPVHWEAADTVLIDNRIRPWIDRKISEFLGGADPWAVNHICDKIAKAVQPTVLLSDIEKLLDDEAEMFVKKLWRLVIYETEYKKLGLAR